MTSARTITTKSNHYFGSLVALAALAMMVAMILAAKPSYAASTTFTVDSTLDFADPNQTDNICDVDLSNATLCTLRAAIEQANTNNNPSEVDRIEFDIPGTGAKIIKPGTALPVITEPVVIDGYSQPGATPNTKTVGNDAVLKIVLDGTNVPDGDGLDIDASGSVIKGLVINGFGNSGIAIAGESVGTRIEGNFIGTDPTGTLDRGNGGDGVLVFGRSSETVVGGSTLDKHNVISGNGGAGVFLFDSNANLIRGNYVGTDKSGTKDLGNDGTGVAVNNESGTTVGGTTAASRNVISGNGDTGIFVGGSQGTKVLGNRIGTNASGTSALGNRSNGVGIAESFSEGSSDNLVGDGTFAGSNIIAFNGRDGVAVFADTSAGNEISRNSIFSNGGLGIDLGGPGEYSVTNVSTPNDAGDTDTGPNGLQNKPVLSSAKTVSGKTTIKGTFSSNTGQTYTIEFYSNPSGDEGKKFIGQKSVTTDGSGNASFTFSPATKVPAGQTITATATNESTGDTSEFSAAKGVVAR
jgi:parallel beta-helix repeat protein